ncbi:TonB-dependent siderophore receptor, partial [Thioclava sp. BHET1]
MQPMRLSLLAFLLGQTALTFLPGAAAAQDTTDLAAIHIRSKDQKSNGTGPVKSANAVTLTGSKTAIPITEIPQSVTVVSHKELQSGNYQKLDAALSYSAGVVGQPYGYDSDTNWFNIRGFSATATGAYEDGLQNFSYGFGGFYIDPILIQRVEVLKGASSVLYGGSNPGGLINFVSKYPTGKDTTAIELGADQHGGLWASIDANRRIDARTSYRLIAKAERVDGNGAFSPGFHGVVSGAVTRVLDDGAALTFGLDYTRVDEDHVGSDWLPYYGTVKPTRFGYIPRNFNTGEPDHDSYKRDQVMAHLHYTRTLGDWTFEDTARAGWSDIDEKSVYAYGYVGYATSPVDADGSMVFDQHTKTGTFLNDAHVSTTRQLGATQHTILLGLDFKSFYMDQVQSSATGTTLTFVDPQYGATQPAAVPYIDQTLHQTQVGLYAQDQIRWGKGWIATANLRNDWVHTSTGTNHATGVAGMSRDDSELSWRLGIAKELPGGLVPYASVSSYFSPQIVTDSNGANTS